MEEVFDSKIQQINFLTEDNIKDKIEEVVAEIEIRPELFDDIYAKKEHSHSNYVAKNEDFTIINSQNTAFVKGDKFIRFWNASLADNDSLYFQMGKGHKENGDCFWMRYINHGRMLFSFFPGGKTMMDFRYDPHMTIIESPLTVNDNLTVGGDLYVKGVKIDGSGGGTVEIPDVINKNLTMGKNLNVSGSLNLYDYGIYWPQVNIVAGSGPNLYIHTENYCNIYGDLQITGATKSTGDLITSSGLTVKKNANISGNLNVSGDLYVKGVKIDGSGGGSGTVEIPSVINVSQVKFGENWNMGYYLKDYFMIVHNQPEIQTSITVLSFDNTSQDVHTMWNLQVEKNLTVSGNLTVGGKINGTVIGNETITHNTDDITGEFEIGTFCETNGGIYTGYQKIDTTDCICQVQQSNTLNPKIVGVITASNQFASHGDVLVKIVPGTYHLGDILCPDITGKARKATETELQYMMLHAIPRAKITSLDTKIEGTVAAFLF